MEKNRMERKLAKLYNKLANKIISMIPGDWEDVHFLGEIVEEWNYSSVFYFRETKDGEYIQGHEIPEKYGVSEEIYEKLSEEAEGIFLKIHDCFVKSGQEIWEQFSMSFDSTGEFKIDFLYDTISSTDYGQAEREIIWAYETFGLMPEEGSFFWKELNEYLENKNK